MDVPTEITLKDIVVEGRIRSELGEIDGLANSIREFGLLQPILLAHDGNSRFHLVAGGRRYLALTRLGVKSLVHGRDWLLRTELADGNPDHKLRLQAIELEENVRRKDLTWQERVLGKQRLLETMQAIHGSPVMGRPSRTDMSTSPEAPTGFSIRKLASLLGEPVTNVQRDLQVARAATHIPQLLHADSQNSALRRLSVMSTVASMQAVGSVPLKNTSDGSKHDGSGEWSLYEGDFRANASKITDNSVDLIVTDLPYASEVDQMSKHATGVADFDDSRSGLLDLLDDVCRHTYRVLRPDRFAVFFFGFNYYPQLLVALETAGMKVNPVPFIWFKSLGGTTQDPYRRYANAYEPLLVAMKGDPKFIRVGRPNLMQLASPANKLHINQKPVELYKNFIFDMTAEGAVCLDWMAGSGTLGVACRDTKRKGIMMEKDSVSCQIIQARMCQASVPSVVSPAISVEKPVS